MAVVAFTSLCSTCSLHRFSPIISIFLVVLTTVSLSVHLEYNMYADNMYFRQATGFSYIQVMSLEL